MSAATESVISRLNARVRPHNPRGAARPPQRALREVDSGAVYRAVCGVHVQRAARSVVYTTWCSAWRRGRGTGSEGRGFWTLGGGIAQS